jgi:MinD-like ATPase involved in chromosome partitioning or flagellar assembly
MSKIVSIHSFRRGTGKSNLAANLAALLAQTGKRVGVIDADFQFPGLHVLFGLDKEKMDRTLNDYLGGNCAIEEAAYDVSRGGIFLVPSSVKPGDIARILREGYDVNLLRDGLRELIRHLNLDYVFIDTHPGLNQETLPCMAASDILIVILCPDRQDYQGTAVTVDVAKKLEVPRVYLVVNKALPVFDTAAARQQIEKTCGAPLAGVLPFSEDMLSLGSAGIFCLRYPDQPWTQAVRQITTHIVAGEIS